MSFVVIVGSDMMNVGSSASIRGQSSSGSVDVVTDTVAPLARAM